jgi:hypothetical protein
MPIRSTNDAYLEFIPKLLGRIKTKLPVALIIFAEGAKSIREIPDVCSSRFDDFSALHENISLGPREMHLTLASLCNSDLLVTSPSGYSHLAAVLCEKPHILAVPFWHSYAALPNTLTELSIVRNEAGTIVSLTYRQVSIVNGEYEKNGKKIRYTKIRYTKRRNIRT